MKKQENSETKRKSIISIIILFAILIVDAIIKIIVFTNKGKLPVQVIKDVFNLVHYENVMTNLATFVLTYTIVFVVIIRFMIKKRERNSIKVNVALSMVLGGGIGNVIDAIIGGSITDYLEVKGLPIMNLDDIIMILGCILFVIFIIIDLLKKDKVTVENKEDYREENKVSEEQKG